MNTALGRSGPASIRAWIPGHGPLLLAVVAAFGVAVLLCLHAGEPLRFSDNYMIQARKSIWDLGLYTADRPPVTYLFYKLCGYTPGRIVLAQNLLCAFSWSGLGLVLAEGQRRPWLRYAVVLLFALAPCCWNIAGWNNTLLTESLSFSLLALVYGALILYLRKPGPTRWGLLCLASLVFSFCRDQNAWFLLVLAGLVWLVKFRVPFKKGPAAYAAFALAVFLLQSHTANLGKRHQFPLYNVVFQRILPVPAFRDWFQNQGAPMHLVGEEAAHDWHKAWASSHGWALYTEPPYQPFRAWALASGKGVYARFLLGRPGYALGAAWSNRADIFSGNLFKYTKRSPPGALFALADWVWFKTLHHGLFLLFLPAYGLLARRSGLDPLPLALAGAALFLGVFAYHADAMEVARHCVTTVVALHLAAFHGLILLGDRAFPTRPQITTPGVKQ